MFDRVLAFMKVAASSLSEATAVTLYNLTGVADLEGDDSDDAGEQAHEQEVFQSLGMVGRPLPPDASGFAEALGARTSDGFVPFGFRDLRLHRAANPEGAGAPSFPAEGVLAFAGYGGGFHSLTPVDGGAGGTIHVIYCPFDFDADGVAQQAHAVTLDPTAGNESISIVHASGAASVYLPSGAQRHQSPNGQTFVQIEDGILSLQSDLLILNGGAVVVGNPTTGPPVALAAGALSPPCPRLFVNPAS